jgi:hypothetical protein
MAYLRWSGSDWYVFAHTNGGLAVYFCGEEDLPIYSTEQIKAFLAGEDHLDLIPGWRRASVVSRQELLWTMRDYLADENGENMYLIGDEEMKPTLRVQMREWREKDKDRDTPYAEPAQEASKALHETTKGNG